ncbi:MAG: TlpA disulfide reductase family protein [Pyrinomonadaceae bacterium]
MTPRGVIFLLSIVTMLGVCPSILPAQTTSVSLRLDLTRKAFAGQSLFCDKNYKCGLFENEDSKVGAFDQEKIPIQVWRDGNGFLIAVDSDGDKDLGDEKKIPLSAGSTIKVVAKKSLRVGKPNIFPFAITHERSEPGGQTVDDFSIVSHYTATGKLRYGRCSANIVLSDIDHDGNFALVDSTRGTNLGLDLNNDGKMYGRAEYHRTSEIVEFCDRSFIVSALTNSRITFSLTPLRLAKVGEVVPKFSFSLLDGKSITSSGLKGKPFVLDFWASWCVPCVEALPEMKNLEREYAGRVEFYSINVDSNSQKKIAETIIDKNELRDFSAIRMQGDDDPLWKVFGGMNLNRLSIPLYVLVDSNGIVKYAGNGGEKLGQLKEKINVLSK